MGSPLIINSSVLSLLLFPRRPLVFLLNVRGSERTKSSIPAVLVNVQPTPLEKMAITTLFSFLVSSTAVSPLLSLYVPLTCKPSDVHISLCSAKYLKLSLFNSNLYIHKQRNSIQLCKKILRCKTKKETLTKEKYCVEQGNK